jgi:hypothetical protein
MADTRASQDRQVWADLRHKAERRHTMASYLTWGSIAVCAVLAAAVSIALMVSAHRSGLPAFASRTPAPAAEQAKAAPPPAETLTTIPSVPIHRAQAIEHELARLQDAMRSLAAERDRLEARVQQLERSVGDVTASLTTGSIGAAPRPENSATAPKGADTRAARQIAAASSDAVEPPSAPPALVVMPRQRPADAPGGPRAEAAEPLRPQTKQVADRAAPQPADSVATRTEFGLDLGGEATMDGLRALWANLRGNHGIVLDDLRPLVTVREGAKPGTVELRLIAGPFANASAAARACMALQARGTGCRPADFDGQRLALR